VLSFGSVLAATLLHGVYICVERRQERRQANVDVSEKVEPMDVGVAKISTSGQEDGDCDNGETSVILPNVIS
jgi:hypothetical protein